MRNQSRIVAATRDLPHPSSGRWAIPLDRALREMRQNGVYDTKERAGVAEREDVSGDEQTTLTCGADSKRQKFSLAAGTAAYTHYVNLNRERAVVGAQFHLTVTFPASAYPTLVVRDGVAIGNDLVTLSPGAAETWNLEFAYAQPSGLSNVSRWVKVRGVKDD